MGVWLLAAEEQIAFADRVLLNKTDLVAEEEKDSIKQRIKVGETGPVSDSYTAQAANWQLQCWVSSC